MLSYVVRRLLWAVPTLLGVTLVCFGLLRMANADPIASQQQGMLRGRQVSSEALQHLRSTYDLDKPWYEQYGKLLGRLVTLDLGNRWQDGRPIRQVLGEALPITLWLSGLSLLIAYLVAIPLGVLSAVRRNSLVDQTLTVVLFVLYSLPSFWVGTMLLVFFASGAFVNCDFTPGPGCFPLQGFHSFEGFDEMGAWEKLRDVAWHLVLPLVALTYNAFAALSRYMRASMLEALQQDFIRTARAKGLSERAVIFGHALRNSLLPVITLLGLTLPQLISGSVVVEWIFGIRGMGLLALEAISMPDYPLVIAIVAFTALITVLGVLLSDLLYALIDPRIRDGQGGAR